MRTGCCFNLSLFPQIFVAERILRSDVVIAFSNGIIDHETQINKCRIRTNIDSIWQFKIPLEQSGVPVDEAVVDEDYKWRERILTEVRSGYNGLKNAHRAESLARRAFADRTNRLLVNQLMSALNETLECLEWNKKVIVRGSTLQRRRYETESEFVLNLCLEAGVERLYGGKRMFRNLNTKLFMDNQVQLVVQRWNGNSKINAMDCALDMIARYDLSEISDVLQNDLF